MEKERDFVSFIDNKEDLVVVIDEKSLSVKKEAFLGRIGNFTAPRHPRCVSHPTKQTISKWIRGQVLVMNQSFKRVNACISKYQRFGREMRSRPHTPDLHIITNIQYIQSHKQCGTKLIYSLSTLPLKLEHIYHTCPTCHKKNLLLFYQVVW